MSIYYNKNMEVRINPIINGKGLYATRIYVKGEIVIVLSGKIYDHPTRETIHIGNNEHIYDEHGIFINHSFTPTTIIMERYVVANTDIEIDDEITFNYNDTEINMAEPFYVDGKAVCGKAVFDK